MLTPAPVHHAGGAAGVVLKGVGRPARLVAAKSGCWAGTAFAALSRHSECRGAPARCDCGHNRGALFVPEALPCRVRRAHSPPSLPPVLSAGGDTAGPRRTR